jgi:hypothetical protein
VDDSEGSRDRSSCGVLEALDTFVTISQELP